MFKFLSGRSGSVFAAIVSCVFFLLLLIGPRISDEKADASCLRNFHFNSWLGFSMNCDGPGFVEAAIDPHTLLEPGNVRQSRPGLIYVAHLMSRPLEKALSLLKPEGADNLHGENYPLYMKSVFFLWFPVFFSYEFLNFIIVVSSVLLFSSVVRQAYPKSNLAVPIGMLLVFNDLVKAYFWSPHTQMFNILLPMICIWGFYETLYKGLLGRRWLFLGVSGGVGLGVLAYPSFSLFLASILAPMPWTNLREERGWKLINLSISFVLCLAPSMIWMAYVKQTVGSYYQHEIERYHQVVWIAETLKLGWEPLLHQLGVYALFYLRAGGIHALPVFALLLLTLVAARWGQGKTEADPARIRALALAGAFECVLSFLFLTALGIAASRLAYMMIPGLLLMTALFVAHVEDRLVDRRLSIFRWTVLLGCLLVGIIEIWKDGPLN